MLLREGGAVEEMWSWNAKEEEGWMLKDREGALDLIFEPASRAGIMFYGTP